jgi:hypothetical protein
MLQHLSLSKLLSHLNPVRFSAWVFAVSGESPPAEVPLAVRAARTALRIWLASLTDSTLDLLDQYAERIVLLTDRIGVDVLAGLRCQLSETLRAEFEVQADQYQRALWLSENDPACFAQALEARDAEALRAKVRCWTGFLAPTGLTALQDADSRSRLSSAMASLLELTTDQIAVQVFLRHRSNQRLIQVSVHYNRPAELVDQVSQGELTHTTLVRALAAYVTYEPDTGALEVLSPSSDHRESIARSVANALLQCSFDAEAIPLRHFDYQKLASPLVLNVGSEPDVLSAKVTSLGYSDLKRQLHFSIAARESMSIHAAASDSIQQEFRFDARQLNAAKIRIQMRPTRQSRARSLTIQLADSHRCNTKSMRDSDRALCERLLGHWGLVRELTNEVVHKHAA